MQILFVNYVNMEKRVIAKDKWDRRFSVPLHIARSLKVKQNGKGWEIITS